MRGCFSILTVAAATTFPVAGRLRHWGLTNTLRQAPPQWRTGVADSAHIAPLGSCTGGPCPETAPNVFANLSPVQSEPNGHRSQ